MYKRYRRNKRRRHHSSKGKKNDRQVVSAIRAMQSASKTNGDSIPDFFPRHKFEDFPISKKLLQNIGYKKYSNPTPIQDAAIPSILEGRDLIGIANTGTGKTAAFLIPLVEKALKDKNQRVLVIVPTRELATQISNELYGFTYSMYIILVRTG